MSFKMVTLYIVYRLYSNNIETFCSCKVLAHYVLTKGLWFWYAVKHLRTLIIPWTLYKSNVTIERM